MPVFATPAPIAASIELGSGLVRVQAAARADTAVLVCAFDESSRADLRAAQRTQVELRGAELTVHGPEGEAGSVAVLVELPAGSALLGRATAAEFRVEGLLGDCDLRTGWGAILTARTGSLVARTGHGQVIAGHVLGRAELASGFGDVSGGRIEGAAELSAVNGGIRVGAVTGELRAAVREGELVVDRAAAAVTAAVTGGRIWLGEVVRGPVTLTTSAGDIEVGVRASSRARLDLLAPAGRVRDSRVDPAGAGEDKVELVARTERGDILVRPA